MNISTGTPKRNRPPDFYLPEYRKRKKIKYIEFGGQTIKQGFVLCRVLSISKIKDKNVLIFGSDITNMKLGSRHTIGILIDVGGTN